MEFSLQDKMKAIKRVEMGEDRTEVCKELKVGIQTFRFWERSKDKYESMFKDNKDDVNVSIFVPRVKDGPLTKDQIFIQSETLPQYQQPQLSLFNNEKEGQINKTSSLQSSTTDNYKHAFIQTRVLSYSSVDLDHEPEAFLYSNNEFEKEINNTSFIPNSNTNNQTIPNENRENKTENKPNMEHSQQIKERSVDIPEAIKSVTNEIESLYKLQLTLLKRGVNLYDNEEKAIKELQCNSTGNDQMMHRYYERSLNALQIDIHRKNLEQMSMRLTNLPVYEKLSNKTW